MLEPSHLPSNQTFNDKKLLRRLTVLYALALSTIALLAITSQILIQLLLSQQAADSRVINIAGRQRMLSQRISKASLAIQQANMPSEREQWTQELQETIQLWERSHTGLQHGDADIGLPGSNSPTIQSMFADIALYHQEILAASKAIIARVEQSPDTPTLSSDIEPFVDTILQAEAQFLQGMDAIVFQYDDEASKRVTHLKHVELILLGITLVVLSLEGIFIFRASIRKLSHTMHTMHTTEAELIESQNTLEQQVLERTKELDHHRVFLQQILDSFPACIMVQDLHGKILLVNQCTTKELGKTKAEMIGKTGEELGIFDCVSRREESIPHIRATGEPFEIEWQHTSDDDTQWFLSLNFPLYNEEKEIESIGTIHLGITERKWLEETYQTLVEYSLQGLVILQAYRYVFVNTMMCNITGYSKEELLAMSMSDIRAMVHPDDQAMVASYHKTRLAGEHAPSHYEHRIIRKDGKLCWVEVYVTMVNYRGKPAAQAAYLDITDRKLTENILMENQSNLITAQRIAHIGNWNWNILNGRLYWSDEVYRIFGLEPQEFEATYEAFLNSIHPEDRALVAQAVKRALEHNKPYSIDHRIIRPDGSECIVHEQGEVSRDIFGKPIRMIGTAQDVTQRVQIEEKIRDLNAQLEQRVAERTAELTHAKEAAEAANYAKSAFLANMSHELRTPLNAILGFTQLMQSDRALPSQYLENLHIIGRSGEHLLSLINDVLEMSKIEAGRTELQVRDIHLYHLLHDIQDMFYLRAKEKGLLLMLEQSLEVPRYVSVDDGKLRQVLINLLSNAIKFTKHGSVILRVSTKDCTTQQDQTISSTNHACLSLHFEVQDTGVGIEPEHILDIFQPFIQVPGQKYYGQDGTGLGLPISQQFVRMMGGSNIFVCSEFGKGSTFGFQLPIAVATSSSEDWEGPERRVVGIAPGQPTYRILVVEDRLENRVLLVQLLESVGFEVKEAENGLQGVELAETWDPHIIFMDMRMPVMDGYEATKRIKATTKGQAMSIIAITASVFDQDRVVILSNGCDSLINKPFRQRNIFDTLVKYLGVQFIYAEHDTAKLNISNTFDMDDEAYQNQQLVAAMADLPAAWLNSFHHAAQVGHISLAQKLLEELQQNDDDETLWIHNALQFLVDEFRFEHIAMLAQDAINKATTLS